MPTRCLICESSAVVSAEAVRAIVLIISALHGFLRATRQLHPHPTNTSPDDSVGMEQVFTLITNGVKESTQKWAENQAFLQDIQRFQFMQHDCLCLRCGALFDEVAGA